MPSCPFSADALGKLLPLTRAFGSQVQLEVDYVMNVDDRGIRSPFGDGDVKAAKAQVCAREYADDSAWLAFMDCQVTDYAHAAANVAACARSAQINTEDLTECVEGREGDRLLRASVERSQRAGAAATPTVTMGGAKYDRGYTEPLLARALCAAIPASKPESCAQFAEPVSVAVTVIVDGQCQDAACKAANFAKFLNHHLDGLQLMELDANAALGQQTLAALGLRPPFAVFDQAIEQEREVFARLQAAGLLPGPSNTGYVLPLAAATQGAAL